MTVLDWSIPVKNTRLDTIIPNTEANFRRYAALHTIGRLRRSDEFGLEMQPLAKQPAPRERSCAGTEYREGGFLRTTAAVVAGSALQPVSFWAENVTSVYWQDESEA
jgi:hypothetical protein